jgi:hypothetical protein
MERFYFRDEANNIFGCEYVFASEEEMDEFVRENWPDSSPYDGGIDGQVVLTVGDSPRSRFAID